MKKWLGAIAVLGLAALVCLFVFNRSAHLDSTKPDISTSATTPNVNATAARVSLPAPTTPAPASTAQTTPNIPAQSTNRPETATRVAALPEPSVPESELPQLSPQLVLENVRAAFRDFRSRFASNPVGTNDEITRALNGENPGQTRFLRMEDGMRLNAKGELVDTWGTPYFLHQLSATEMEIHSAGPDKRLGTADDLVIK